PIARRKRSESIQLTNLILDNKRDVSAPVFKALDVDCSGSLFALLLGRSALNDKGAIAAPDSLANRIDDRGRKSSRFSGELTHASVDPRGTMLFVPDGCDFR